jgi:hypothetical protein
MKMHWYTFNTCVFFSVEALGPFGIVRYTIFFVIRKTHGLGIASASDTGAATADTRSTSIGSLCRWSRRDRLSSKNWNN